MSNRLPGPYAHPEADARQSGRRVAARFEAKVLNRASESGLSLLTAGRLREAAKPQSLHSGKHCFSPFIGESLSLVNGELIWRMVGDNYLARRAAGSHK